jgi:hypothetical protein
MAAHLHGDGALEDPLDAAVPVVVRAHVPMPPSISMKRSVPAVNAVRVTSA